MKALIVYWSGMGHTAELAEAVKGGLENGGAEVELSAVADFSGSVEGYDLVVLGCPSMGCEELEDAEFLPFYEANQSVLAGKNVALFGTYGWGDGEWMRNWTEEAKEKGMNLVCDGFALQEDEDIASAGAEFASKLV